MLNLWRIAVKISPVIHRSGQRTDININSNLNYQLNSKPNMTLKAILASLLLSSATVFAGQSGRQQWLLTGADWQFSGAGATVSLPEIGSAGFTSAPWQPVTVPHVFQTRAHFKGLTHGWYRREFTVPPASAGQRLYLVF